MKKKAVLSPCAKIKLTAVYDMACEEERFFWGIESNCQNTYGEIPKYLYKALLKFKNGCETIEVCSMCREAKP